MAMTASSLRTVLLACAFAPLPLFAAFADETPVAEQAPLAEAPLVPSIAHAPAAKKAKKPYQVTIPNPQAVSSPTRTAALRASILVLDRELAAPLYTYSPERAAMASLAHDKKNGFVRLTTLSRKIAQKPAVTQTADATQTPPQANAQELAMAEASLDNDDTSIMMAEQEAPAAPATPAAPIPLEATASAEAPAPESAPAVAQAAPVAPVNAAPAPETSIVAAIPPIPTSDSAGEPAPSLDPASRKILANIPSQLDKAPSGTQHIVLDRTAQAAAIEPSASGAAPATGQGGPFVPLPGEANTGVPGTPAKPADGTAVVAPEIAAQPKPDIKISRNPARYDVRDDLERAYDALMAGDTQGAVGFYNSALAHDEKNQNALFGIAATYQRAGQSEKAKPYYSRLLAINPTHRGALNNFLALIAEQAPQEALTELEMLQQRNPDFSPIPAQMAVISYRIGQVKDAIQHMTRALTLAPENLAYRYNLAILLDHAGQRDDAAALYQQLVDASLRGQAIPGSASSLQHRLTFLRSNRS